MERLLSLLVSPKHYFQYSIRYLEIVTDHDAPGEARKGHYSFLCKIGKCQNGNKNILKTFTLPGANTGIGKETAKDLSARGARIIILCRNLEKGNAAAAEINKETGSPVDVEKLDLASLKSVRECANVLLEKESQIDILVNNAGIMTCPHWKTEDGFDMQFGTNHLGHFLLTELLMPLIRKSAEAGNKPR